MGAASQQLISVSTLLGNVSVEVDRLADLAEGLDALIGDLAAANPDQTVPLPTAIQDVDVLRQALHAIAKITAAAAKAVPSESDASLPKGELAIGVTLEKTREACLSAGRGTSMGTPTAEEPVFLDEF